MKRCILLCLFVAVMAMAGCGGSGNGAVDTSSHGYVTGTVKGAWWVPEGNPVHPAENVAVDHNDGDSYAVSIKTTDDGSFALSMPPGTHTIRLSRDGFESKEMTATVEAGKTTVIASEGSDHIAMKTAPMPKAKWTVMYYIDVNNDLFGAFTWFGIGGEFYYGLSEPSKPYDHAPGLKDTLQDDINVVVYSSPSRSDDNPYFTKPSLTVINNKIAKTTPKDWDGESQEAYKAATLKEFVDEVMKTYPAEHYMLVIENHGGGIYGICFEGSNHISMRDLGSTLKELNLNRKDRIEIVSLSACLMGMFEVAYELKDTNVDYLVAYETTGDPHGFPVHGQYVEGIEGFFYPSSTHYPFSPQIRDAETKDKIKWLTHITTRDARETAQLLVYEQFAQSMQVLINKHINPKGDAFCASAIDLKKFSEKGGVADIFVNNFAKEVINNNLPGFRRETQQMYTGSETGHMYAADYYDLREFSNLWATKVGNKIAQQFNEALAPSFLFSSDQKTTVSNGDGRALIAVSQYNNTRLNGLSVLMGKFSLHPEIKELQIYKDCPQWYDYWDQF